VYLERRYAEVGVHDVVEALIGEERAADKTADAAVAREVVAGHQPLLDTVDADDILGHGNVEQMVADEMEGFDAIGSRQLQLLDGVDLVVHEAEALDVAHVGEDVFADRSQVRFLDAQQLNVFQSPENETVQRWNVQMGQFQVADHRQAVESVRLEVAYSGRKENHLHITQT